MRLTRVLVWIGVLVLVTVSVATYGQLPDMIPTHISASGEPGRLVPRTLWAWILPAGIGVLTVLFTDALGSRLPQHPEWFNFPSKVQLLALPADYRTEPIARLQTMMDAVNLYIIILLLIVQWMLWRGAHGQSSQAASLLLLITSPVLLIGIGLYLQVVQRAIDDAEHRYASRRNPLA